MWEGLIVKKIKSGKVLLGVAAVIIIAVFFIAFNFLNNIYATTTYYVLNQDVASRTLITPEMLKPIITQEGTAPPTALNLSEVQSGTLYSQYPLSEGSIISNDNISGYEDISSGIPDDWVITSFTVDSNNAVGGRIKQGTYFDMLVNTDEGSFYPFVNILTLETNVSMSNSSNSDSTENKENTADLYNSQASQYVVGMPPEDAGRLQDIIKKFQGNINLVVSPKQNNYNLPDLTAYKGLFTYRDDTSIAFGVDPINLGQGTDQNFSKIERDAFGRPTGKIQNCSKGNLLVSIDEKTGKCPTGSSLTTNEENLNTETPQSSTPEIDNN